MVILFPSYIRRIALKNTFFSSKNPRLYQLLDENQANPIVLSEFKKKFPITRLGVRKYVTLTTVQYATSPSVYNILLRWTEPDGSRVADQVYVPVEARIL
ncbi:hypothetical protein [Legionella sp. km772]|uniref:hypothetical protein n=1 Tax=Legionella sp. km772 TaxID=2498111 RepID=UPI000F8DE921|nr:hypothetical protein [Legionella sp. km772]RUR10546.1 hypothetical protein ELY15_08075 [Legionella sp. km772]